MRVCVKADQALDEFRVPNALYPDSWAYVEARIARRSEIVAKFNPPLTFYIQQIAPYI
jgi:hypothetical protein